MMLYRNFDSRPKCLNIKLLPIISLNHLTEKLDAEDKQLTFTCFFLFESFHFWSFCDSDE